MWSELWGSWVDVVSCGGPRLIVGRQPSWVVMMVQLWEVGLHCGACMCCGGPGDVGVMWSAVGGPGDVGVMWSAVGVRVMWG
uniref:Uncharacterized protein n=1 Tax=Knipowitschia caucasica TaxID=637954 RepID=A0AAV2MNL7_KNICA